MSEPLDLEAIKAREKAASPGPWECEPRDCGFSPDYGGKKVAQDTALAWGDDNHLQAHLSGPKEPWGRGDFTVRDAWFIANARQDIPALIAEVERLREIEWRMKGLEK